MHRPDYITLRNEMVEGQLVARGISHPRVLQAMRNIPREAFIDQEWIEHAYDDGPLPIGEEQTISQPYIVALMIELARPQSQDIALEIGTGSGYAAAVLSQVVSQVYTIERHPSLARQAETCFKKLGYKNIATHVGDGSLGRPDHAPYDIIIATAGAPKIPTALREQLRIGGRLVIPVGPTRQNQQLVVVTRMNENEFKIERQADVKFVPLVGSQSWPD